MLFFPHEKEISAYRESGEPEFMKIQLSQILGNYRFKIKTNPMHGSKTVYAQNLMKFLQVVSADQGRHPALVKEIAKYLEIQNANEMFDNPAERALQMIIQAHNEGLLANSKQAALILGEVVNILAPQGSETATRMGKQITPPTNEAGVGSQMGQEMAL